MNKYCFSEESRQNFISDKNIKNSLKGESRKLINNNLYDSILKNPKDFCFVRKTIKLGKSIKENRVCED